ncbi:MAG: 2-amino-4-hydroxy-6-hydroxymethyldihydropteridine diphosphokinase [Dehalococcoidia bacterium]
MAEVVLALGSNLGDRFANLRAAVSCLADAGVVIDRVSAVWETPPFPAGQPRYLNAALVGTTALDPHDLLAVAKQCEERIGRTATYRWGPRIIDIDILFYGDLALETPDLVIPHPRITERAFVLVPLAGIWDGPLPVLGVDPALLLASLSLDGIDETPFRLAF